MFARHAGNQLKKWLGITHTDDVTYDNSYTYVEVPGKVVYRSEEDADDNLMVLRAPEDFKINRRSFVVTNPEIGRYTPYSSEGLYEPGETPTVYIHNYEGFFEEMELEWLFRIYFIK